LESGERSSMWPVRPADSRTLHRVWKADELRACCETDAGRSLCMPAVARFWQGVILFQIPGSAPQAPGTGIGSVARARAAAYVNACGSGARDARRCTGQAVSRDPTPSTGPRRTSAAGATGVSQGSLQCRHPAAELGSRGCCIRTPRRAVHADRRRQPRGVCRPMRRSPGAGRGGPRAWPR